MGVDLDQVIVLHHLAGGHEPRGPLPQPKGKPRSGGPEGSNLIWLRPGDEADLVESLAEVGLIVVSVVRDGGEPG